MPRQSKAIIPTLRRSLLLAVVAGVLVACGGGPAPTPAIIVVTATVTPEPAVVVVVATFSPTPEGLPAETPTLPPPTAGTAPAPSAVPASPTAVPASPTAETTPAPTAGTTPALAQSGSFSLVTPDQGLPEGEVNSLWIAPDGTLWVATAQGVFRYVDGAWTQLMPEPARWIQGADDQGRVWVILEEETAIAAYDPTGAWTRYGPEQGWSPTLGGGEEGRKGRGTLRVLDDR
ncbi:hypothetical protein ACFLWA_10940, partial [Chloroflexota bacterium]